MKVNDWVANATRKLELSDISTYRLDALVLLEDAVDKDRSWLLAHPEHYLDSNNIKLLDQQIDRRSKHEPLAYIRGKSEFYGREFIVNEHTLEPRPETETMIELLKALLDINLKSQNPQIIDVGTGSGCLAITAKLEFPKLEVSATDFDEKCVQTSGENALKHATSINLLHGDLLKPVMSTSNIGEWVILANLPYVPDGHAINKAAMFEPRHAIFGGPDGLDLYRRMFNQVNSIKNKPSYMFTESLPFQHKDLEKIANSYGYKQIQEKDLIQVFNYQ